ncbi:MAG: glycosyltransferase family 39 protein, partial [Actinomycetota bacterium]|nr:glycosyltransferase family 39 protein [Actinomycetota bacterium]
MQRAAEGTGRVTGAVLAGVLVLQAVLTVRLSNSAFQDEATYVFAGHRVLALWLHGTPTYDDYPSYFSGAPFLYPVAAAVADSIGSLEAARALSLMCALASTVLLYLVARRLFDPAVAVGAAFVFAVAEPTLFTGRLATYDAAALLLVALAVWIGVRWSTSTTPALVLMPPVLVLAIFTKYALVLYVPAAIAVSAIAVARDRGRRAALVHAAVVTGLVAV